MRFLYENREKNNLSIIEYFLTLIFGFLQVIIILFNAIKQLSERANYPKCRVLRETKLREPKIGHDCSQNGRKQIQPK